MTMSTAANPTLSDRLVSLDAYRGLTMLAMASGGLGLHEVARRVAQARSAQNLPESDVWQFIGYQFEHVPWVGCAVWDLIQPSFMFMVGVAMAYSCASRQSHGQSYGRMFRHALVRSVVLILLGIVLRSDGIGRSQTNFTFEDVLTQIGLGYTFLFLLWGRGALVQFAAAIAILAGYWCYFYYYPLPALGFDYGSVGAADVPRLEGLAAHWDKNTNAAAAFDQWFLNLFPRAKPFVYNGGGYLTLSFIPSLATMIFGLLSGELLRSPRRNSVKFWGLVLAGLAGLAAGELLQSTGVCPIVKRIWTPSWALFSTGWTCLILAAFFGFVDVLKFRAWTFPLVVVGMNSITMYCLAELTDNWFLRTLKVHFGRITFFDRNMFTILDKPYAPLVSHLWVLLAMWLVCYWLYRQKIFIRI